MAQTNFTPISLYHSTTAAAVPTAGNLVAGELAINITDGKLYYEDNTGVVRLLASTAASSPVTSFQTSLSGLTPSTSTTGAVTLAGTLGTSSGGTGLTTVGSNGQVLGVSGGVLAYITPSGTTGSSLTIALTGGATAPATFNGSSAVTIDYSTVGADQVGTAVAMAIALG
jgi:hypothetical protein